MAYYRLTVAPDVRFSLDYLEDKVSLVANSMRKMQEKINNRSDDLISKDELEWLFSKFQLRIQGPSMDRLWRHFDNHNAGQVSFASITQNVDTKKARRAVHNCPSIHKKSGRHRQRHHTPLNVVEFKGSGD